MKLYLIDYDGNKVCNPTLTQYDAGQKLLLTNFSYDVNTYPVTAPIFQFWNEGSDTATSVISTHVDGSGAAGTNAAVFEAEIPNRLLQVSGTLTVAIYLQATTDTRPSKTAWMTTIPVVPRVSPDFEIDDNEREPMTATEIYNIIDGLDATWNAKFADAFDGCVVRISNTAPTAASYGDETRPVITFVMGA